MTLDIVVRHLHWCHAKVIRSKEQDWYLQLLVQWDRLLRSMEDGVVHHQHSSKAPVGISMVEVTDKLHDEETEGVTVGVATVDSEQELATSG